MALTPEQIIDLKEQLKSQVENLSPEKKAQALAQIDALSPQALELMLKQQGSSPKEETPNKGVFRMIIDSDIKSVRVEEDKISLAVLDINPISRGHCIIIPKKAVKDAKQIPNSCFTLAKKIAKRIVKKLKAKSTEIQTDNKFGEVIINVIPSYTEPLNLNSPRGKSNNEELETIAEKLRPVIKKKVQKVKIEKQEIPVSQILKIKRRVP
ncbi:MAG: HIT family protein [archaeon]